MLEYILFTLLTTAVLVVSYLYWIQRGSDLSLCDIPGPKPVNKLDGNIPDIVKCGGFHPFLLEIHKKYGHIASFWWGPKHMVSIASAELFKRQAKFFDRAVEVYEFFQPLFGPSAIPLINGSEARRRHRAYTACLNTQNLPQFYNIIYKNTNEVLNSWSHLVSESQNIPLRKHMMTAAVKSALQSIMGDYFENEENVDKLWQSSEHCWLEIQRQLNGDKPPDNSPRDVDFEHHKNNARMMISNALKHRQAGTRDRGDNLIIDAALGMEMPDEAMMGDMMDFLLSSIHTTGLTMTWGLYFLACNPDMQEKVHKEVTQVLGKDRMNPDSFSELVYLNQVIKETLRCTSIVPFNARYQATDIELGGYQLRPGMPVVHALGVLHNDPTIFPEPERFKPDRFSPENIKTIPAFAFEPFGFAGGRKCPGHRFALLEATIMLTEVLREFRVSLVKGQVVTPVYGLITEPKEEIWLTAQRRAAF